MKDLDKRVCLKVKIKSLAEEAKIIRKEEKKARSWSYKKMLQDHRKGIVREEARHTHLAYGFIRGKSYAKIEHCRFDNQPNWDKVTKMVNKYCCHIDYPQDWSNMEAYRKYEASMDAAAALRSRRLAELKIWIEEAKKIIKITV